MPLPFVLDPLPPGAQLWLLSLLMVSTGEADSQHGRANPWGERLPVCIQSVLSGRGQGLPAQLRPGLGGALGARLWVWDRESTEPPPLPLSPQIFLLNHSLASARFPFGENVPMNVPSAPPSFSLQLCANLALGPLVQDASQGHLSPALTVSIFRARSCARGTVTRALNPTMCSPSFPTVYRRWN